LFANFDKLNFKIVKLVTMTIVGRDGCNDDPRFWRSYSVKEKRELMQSMQLLMEEQNVSARQAYLSIGVYIR
jgi:hypothetical protein